MALGIMICTYAMDGNKAMANKRQAIQDTIPQYLFGSFMDDYGIQYTITDSLWIQLPNIRYHIIEWNAQQQYIIARNDTANKSDKGLYTRIDYMDFKNMEPYRWGFCLTVYDAFTDSVAIFATPADRLNPKKGCNGYPFSRMKKIGQ